MIKLLSRPASACYLWMFMICSANSMNAFTWWLLFPDIWTFPTHSHSVQTRFLRWIAAFLGQFSQMCVCVCVHSVHVCHPQLLCLIKTHSHILHRWSRKAEEATPPTPAAHGLVITAGRNERQRKKTPQNEWQRHRVPQTPSIRRTSERECSGREDRARTNQHCSFKERCASGIYTLSGCYRYPFFLALFPNAVAKG